MIALCKIHLLWAGHLPSGKSGTLNDAEIHHKHFTLGQFKSRCYIQTN